MATESVGAFKSFLGNLEDMTTKLDEKATKFANWSILHSNINRAFSVEKRSSNGLANSLEKIRNIFMSVVFGVGLFLPAAVFFSAQHIKEGLSKAWTTFSNTLSKPTNKPSPQEEVKISVADPVATAPVIEETKTPVADPVAIAPVVEETKTPVADPVSADPVVKTTNTSDESKLETSEKEKDQEGGTTTPVPMNTESNPSNPEDGDHS